MTTRKEQLESMASQAIVRNPTDPRIVEAAEALHEAINAFQGIRVSLLPGNCWTWSAPGSGSHAQASFLSLCTEWNQRILGAQQALATALTQGGDPGWAEAVGASADQTQGVIETLETTVDIGNPFDLTPPWVKWGIPLVAGLFLWKAIK